MVENTEIPAEISFVCLTWRDKTSEPGCVALGQIIFDWIWWKKGDV